MKVDPLLLVKTLLYLITRIESTKFTNKEFRNARNYYNLYDHNINPKWKDIKDKERLGIRKISNLPPLNTNNNGHHGAERSISPTLQHPP